ncbi:prolyl-tRNA synthetase, cytoplasmic [Scheffersomyces coipomensis]|uniref:prolyl-tRNA synthetase, cytoplasmic n=1 Tax=Scheffersomyces coipomensis TaxID=1788519 RepID=UPI00315E0038
MISRRLLHIKTVPKLYATNIDSLNFSQSKSSPSVIPTIPTHELLTKLNLISHPHSGLINWLPIGLTIINKINAIIRSRMNEVNFEELQLSLLSHKSLWEQTNRLNNNQEIFQLKDEPFLLSPTAEEEITNYVKQNIKSYKNLPILYYQINNKYRNEKRPRSGLLRTKEFLMKDGYSFDINEKEAMNTYQNVFGAYINIFNDLKLPYVKAEADSGDIGGSLSHEWHYLHQSGEDLLFECDHCHSISNIEKTLSFPNEEKDVKDVSVRYFITKDGSTLVCAYYPSDRVLQPNFIKVEIDDIDVSSKLTQKEILSQFETNEQNEDSLMNKKIIRIMDSRLTSRSNFPDFPLSFINRSAITTFTDIPIVEAQADEICGKCEEGKLSSSKAIEIGHTFYLGDKYSKSLDCTIETPDLPDRQNLIMGCYGIGISRIVASIAEINRDSNGLIWPAIIAPWNVTIISVNGSTDPYNGLFEKLNDENVDYKVDNRAKIGLGKKINQSNLLGIPLIIILGKNYPIVEIEIRGKRYDPDGELAWKKLYESHKDEYQWKVEYDEGQNDVKHYVHKDGIISVINALLKDM